MMMNATNHTENDTFSCYSPSVVGYRYFAVLWGCAVTITGTVGNLMTVLAFALDPRLRTRFNVLIINLAVADLLYCTVLQPISVDSYLHLRWRSGELWCNIFGLLLFLSNSVSIITLCLVAVSRYLLLIYRRVRIASKALLRYRLSRRSSRKKPAAVDQETDDSGVESGPVKTCSSEMRSQDELDHNTNDINNEKSFLSTQNSATPDKSASDKYQSPAPTSAPPSSGTSGDDNEFKRVTRMCFTVFLCFVCCFVPFLLLNIADKHNRAPQVLHMFCANLTWLNSCINPVLYAIMNRQFRQAYNVLLSRAAAPFLHLRASCQNLRSEILKPA